MSILIGLHVIRTLSEHPDVKGFVGDRIYPIVVPQGVDKYPYIVYDCSGGIGDTTKDGNVDDTATVQMSVISKSYEEALMIGQLVRYAFDGYTPDYPELSIRNTGGITYNDEYIEALDAYAVNLSIEFRTIDQ